MNLLLNTYQQKLYVNLGIGKISEVHISILHLSCKFQSTVPDIGFN